MSRNSRNRSEDIIRSTLAEISLFLLFFSLFLMFRPEPGIKTHPVMTEERLYLTFDTGKITFAQEQDVVSAEIARIAEELIGLVQRFGADTIEVVGHTDYEVVPRKGRCQLLNSIEKCIYDDTKIIELLQNGKGVIGYRSNSGLGMARAAAVIPKLRTIMVELNKERIDIDTLRFHPLSASYLYDINGNLNTETYAQRKTRSDPAARRVEFRVRKRSEEPIRP